MWRASCPKGRDLRAILTRLGVVLILGLLAVRASAFQEPDDSPVVERVEIAGNRYVARETFLHYISTKAGDRFDPVRLRSDFQRLWATGFLDDLVLHADDTPSGGKLVRFLVDERSRVLIVDFRGSKALTTTTIQDELKKQDAAVKIDAFHDLGRARRVESIIRQMLADKGRPFATVRHEAKVIGGAGIQLSFVIDDGPRARVVDIAFVGNEVFSDRRLRRVMKVKKRGLWNLTWLLGKTTYTEDKWSDPMEGDRKRLSDFFLAHGYVTAVVGEPRLRYVEAKTGKKPVKGLRLEIPVTEGEQHRVGKLELEAMTVLKQEYARPLFKLKAGDVYDENKIRKGLDKLREAYGSLGYFQWTARTERKQGPQNIVDVTLVMEEDKRYYVGRIEFTGNNTTRDKVIRREVYLSEGDVFNTEALKLSIRRINQLGYFKPMEGAPELRPSERGDEFLDITMKVEEQNRNQFTFGGGVSGLEGAFLNASFQTANFLGLGETFSIGAQTGSRSNNYQIAITEPYLLDRPITAGIDLFSRKLDYVASDNALGYSEVRTGGSFTTGIPLRRFSRLFANYTYEVIDTAVRDDLLASGTTGTASAEPLLTFVQGEGRNQESRLTPSFVHNSVDNPYTPRRGLRLTGTFSVAGGPLGGTVDYLRRDLEGVLYLPHLKRTALGLRGQVGWITPFGSTRELPYYQRFFLGGETQIRGLNARTVSPLDKGNRAVGGNKFLLLNAEYYFDIGPLRALAFFDAGEAYRENQGLFWKTLRTSLGAEMRFLMPVLNVPFRLIYAVNANRDAFQPKRVFKFAVGTTF